MHTPPDPQHPGASAERLAARMEAARLRRGGDEPASAYEEAYRKGAVGERILGDALNGAARDSGRAAVAHDLVLPGKRANIDHVVVGPAGITVIDAKAWTGRVWVGRVTIGQGRHARRSVMDGMRRQVNRIHERLAVAGRDDVPVRSVLCLVNGGPKLDGRGLQRVDGIGVADMAGTIDFAFQDGPIPVPDVVALHELLSDGFRVNGGSVLPDPAFVPEPSLVTPQLRPTRRPWGRILRSWFLRAAVIWFMLTLLAVCAWVVAGLVQSTTQPMTRSELTGREPELRTLARQRAQSRVRGPRVTTHRTKFVLTYRGSRRCRVRVSVSRLPDLLPAMPPQVSSSRCG